MSTAFDLLESLRARVAAFDPEECLTVPQLAIARRRDEFHVDFYGLPFDSPYVDLLETLARPEVAPHVASIRLRAPDEGANGTQNWNLEPLLASGAAFDRLAAFEIELSQLGEHNRRIVAESYDENGVLGRLLERAPELMELTVPSAPDASFFAVGERPLRHLSIDAGYDRQGFLERLAESDCFPDLRELEWGEYAETYMQDFAANCTPKAAYAALFESPTFQSLRSFTLRNPQLSDNELRELRRAAPRVQMFVIRVSDL